MEENHDIVARAESAAGGSTGAVAAYVGRACGHVWLDERIITQGYRFYPWMSDEIPHFFNKRFMCGKQNLAITLQAGLSFDHDDPFEDCGSNAEARVVLESDRFESSLWKATITIGNDLYTVEDVANPLFIAKYQNEFRLISDELIALGLIQRAGCPMCTESHD